MIITDVANVCLHAALDKFLTAAIRSSRNRSWACASNFGLCAVYVPIHVLHILRLIFLWCTHHQVLLLCGICTRFRNCRLRAALISSPVRSSKLNFEWKMTMDNGWRDRAVNLAVNPTAQCCSISDRGLISAGLLVESSQRLSSRLHRTQSHSLRVFCDSTSESRPRQRELRCRTIQMLRRLWMRILNCELSIRCHMRLEHGLAYLTRHSVWQIV